MQRILQFRKIKTKWLKTILVAVLILGAIPIANAIGSGVQELLPYRIENGRAFFRTDDEDDIPEYVLENPDAFNFVETIHEHIDEETITQTEDIEEARTFAPNYRQIESRFETVEIVGEERNSTTNETLIPEYVLDDPERFDLRDETTTTYFPVVEEIFTGERITSETLDNIPLWVIDNPERYNFLTTENEREIRVATGARETVDRIEDVPYWVLVDEETRERYEFEKNIHDKDVWEYVEERDFADEFQLIPEWVRENPIHYNLETHVIGRVEVEGSRQITDDFLQASSHDYWEEIEPLLISSWERIFGTTRSTPVLEIDIPVEVLNEAELFDLALSGTFNWGAVQHSATHPGNRPDINIYGQHFSGNVPLANIDGLQLPEIGDIVTHGGFDWEVIASDDGRSNPIYSGGPNVHGGTWDWNTIRSIASGWGWTFPINAITAQNNGNAGVATHPNWHRFPILSSHYTRTTVGGVTTYNTTSNSPFNAAHIDSETIRRAVEIGYMYMTFTVTGTGSNPNVQWFKFLPSVEYNWSFDLQRFSFQEGTPLWHWLEYTMVEVKEEIPQFAFWKMENIYSFSWDRWEMVNHSYILFSWNDYKWETEYYELHSWDESLFEVSYEKHIHPYFSWYMKDFKELEIERFEFWKTYITRTFTWDVEYSEDTFYDVDPDGVTPELDEESDETFYGVDPDGMTPELDVESDETFYDVNPEGMTPEVDVKPGRLPQTGIQTLPLAAAGLSATLTGIFTAVKRRKKI